MRQTDYHNPTDEFVRSIDIHELLPQQEPFIMISSLLHYDKIRTVSSFMIPADNLFVEGGRFTSTGLMENIAQTCAARIGYINKYILGKSIQMGFIGAIRDMEILSCPSVGESIVTEIIVQEEIFGMILATAKVSLGDRVLVNAEMKIAVRDEDTESK